ncbi:MAG: hypothetical protein ACOYJ1_15400 [Peptococcales bacterium]|jgi:hypothetical protein
MRKQVAVILTLLLFLSLPLTARSAFNLSLGFGATYCPPEKEDFSSGMGDSRNWILSGELNGRLFFLQAQATVMLTKSEEDTQALKAIALVGLNLPVVGSWMVMELSGGVGVTYVPQNPGVVKPYYALSGGGKAAVEEVTFLDAVLQSPIHLQMGLGTDFGPLGLRARYVVESNQTIESVMAKGRWWEIFVPNSGCFSLAVLLKMS